MLLLDIQELTIEKNDRFILDGLNLSLPAGEIHARYVTWPLA
jgi:Fe-S cluster assembly ATPase SufC